MNHSSASDEAMPLRTDEDRNEGENTKERRASVGLYRWFDLILPCGIIVLAINGWYYSFVQIGIRYLIQRNRRAWFGSLYILVTQVMFCTLMALILYTVSTRWYSGRDGFSDPPDTSLLTEPYECVNSKGDLQRCKKSGGPCCGKWKPPRTHHCSTCGICRPGFDHHCPWLGTCIRSSNLPAFLLVLVITPILFLSASLPILPILPARIIQGLRASRETPWIRERWWDKWYSWIFFGGPPGRYVIGTLLGLKELECREDRDHNHGIPGNAIANPGVKPVLTVFFAFLLSIFAIIMAFAIIRMITLGETTLDTLGERQEEKRGSLRFLCIPAASSSDERRVYEILAGEKLYDLGWRENWRKLFLQVKRNGIFGTDERFSWPKISPTVLKHHRDSAPTI